MFQIINKVFAFICQLFGCFISNHYLCCQKHNVDYNSTIKSNPFMKFISIFISFVISFSTELKMAVAHRGC